MKIQRTEIDWGNGEVRGREWWVVGNGLRKWRLGRGEG